MNKISFKDIIFNKNKEDIKNSDSDNNDEKWLYLRKGENNYKDKIEKESIEKESMNSEKNDIETTFLLDEIEDGKDNIFSDIAENGMYDLYQDMLERCKYSGWPILDIDYNEYKSSYPEFTQLIRESVDIKYELPEYESDNDSVSDNEQW